MRQIIFTIILIILIAATGYLWYNSSPQSSTEEAIKPVLSGSRLTELRRLKTLQLDVSILKDPLFASLQHPLEILGTEVIQIQAGRVNPFLPF
jgi:hypothetical protein